MSVNLQKGQKVDLTKGNTALKRIVVGLGWDAATESKGLLGGLFGGGSSTIDCDASAIMCGEGGKLKDIKDVVYYGNLSHKSGSIKHMGDNLTGEGEGDDEQITINLQAVPQNFEKIVFVVNIYQAKERKQHFGLINNAFIRIFDADSNVELCKYNLSEKYDNMTAMIFGEVYRHQNDWKFNAIGQATQDDLTSLSRKYQ